LVATTNLAKHIRAFRGSVQRKARGNQEKKSGERGFDEECQPIREGEEHRGRDKKRVFTANKKKQKSAIMEEEVQALVVDNGSGMCKAGE
jgi:hypothetical protein